ncbi:MAG: peptidase domain-containing ABC transporter [Sphingobacteriales bacterium]|nr:MAG: peptidase domain-containing ABC transporter [Sphingobacteriales bacterium]
MKRPFPFYKQYDQMDCGVACLRMICKHYGKTIAHDIISERAHLNVTGTSLGGLAEAAETFGLQTLVFSCKFQVLKDDVPLPAIIYWKQRHFIIVYDIIRRRDKTYVKVADPGYGLITYSEKEFLDGWLGLKYDSQQEGIVMGIETLPEFHDIDAKTTESSKVTLLSLLSYMRPYKRYFIQILCGLLIGSLVQMILPFLTQAIVDKGVDYGNINFIYLILFAQLTLYASLLCVDIIRNWILLFVSSRINIKLVSVFIIKLMKLPIGYFDSKNIGDLMQRIQDHNRIQNFISTSSLNALFSILNIVIFSIVLCYYSVAILIVFLIASALYIVWNALFLKKRAEIDFKMFDQAAGNQNSLIQIITGIQEIKLNGSAKRRRWEWEALQARLYKISTKSLSISQVQGEGAEFIDQIKNAIITFMSAKMVIDGQISLGTMLSVQFIIGQLSSPINGLVSFFQVAQDAHLSLKRIHEIHQKRSESDGQDEVPLQEIPSSKSIRLNNVSFRYGTEKSPLVLKNITCTIQEGKTTAIVGASGCGKTTLLKLLLRFYNPSQGEIKVGELNLSTINPDQWRSLCACVMQEGHIFSDTIIKNISESEKSGLIDVNRVHQSAAIANIGQLIADLPRGYQTRIGASGLNLSTGQKQRILIARAAYKDPSYLFLDEATSALDANNEKAIINNLAQFSEKRTVVVVAHRLSTVVNADNIIVMNDGRIVEEGTHSELIPKRGLYYSLIKNQLELGN